MSGVRAPAGRRRSHRLRVAWLVCVIGVATGCTEQIDLVPLPPQPEPAAGAGVSFPECQADEYDFIGESTLAALGLQAHVPAQLPEPGRPAMIWVTRDLLPHDSGPPGGAVEMTRMLCFEFADGGGGSGWPVDDDWQPPAQ
jgi:hypothetical protein